MFSSEKTLLGRIVTGCFLILLAALMLWLAVWVVQQIWVWILVAVLVVAVIATVVAVVRVRRDRWFR